MEKKQFRITYRDPETGESKTHMDVYEDTPGIATSPDGTSRDVGRITAREWAEDHAYSLADKGPYTIKSCLCAEASEARRKNNGTEPDHESP